MANHNHVVVLIHGIRTRSLWQTVIRSRLEKEGFHVEPTNYEYFDLIRFLIPIPYFRNAAIDNVWGQIEQVIKDHPGKQISFIAHSFGTYVLAQLLKKKILLKAHRVIFCGSVVRYNFPFEHVDTRFDGPILNEVGTLDFYPALADSVTWGYGSAGTYGFRRPKVRDRWHNGFRHSDFLTSEFCGKFWIEFLESGKIKEGDLNLESSPWWIQFLSIIKLKYALLVISAIAAACWWHGRVCEPPRQVSEWIHTVANARERKTISSSKPLPPHLVNARTQFESWWQNTGFNQKACLAPKAIFEAVSSNLELYRSSEVRDLKKPNSFYWSNECSRFFEQSENPKYLRECLIEHAALILELSQIQHTEPEEFKRTAEDGDKVMARAMQFSTGVEIAEVNRLWSRFLYNLGRPQGGVLSKQWNGDYLALAYQRAVEAVKIQKEEIRNHIQLARSAQKLANNGPQYEGASWTKNLVSIRDDLGAAFKKNAEKLNTSNLRIPPLNILAVLSMDIARRKWLEGPQDAQVASTLVSEIENEVIPRQREVLILLVNTEWEKVFDFDVAYDLARSKVLLSVIQAKSAPNISLATMKEAIANLEDAAMKATPNQLRGALVDLEQDPIFMLLEPSVRVSLREVFAVR